MAITILNIKDRRIVAGQNGYTEVTGMAQFSTTDLTGEIPCRISRIEHMELTPLKGAADERVLLDEDGAAGGYIARPSTKTLSVKRAAETPTSGLKFTFRYSGY